MRNSSVLIFLCALKLPYLQAHKQILNDIQLALDYKLIGSLILAIILNAES